MRRSAPEVGLFRTPPHRVPALLAFAVLAGCGGAPQPGASTGAAASASAAAVDGASALAGAPVAAEAGAADVLDGTYQAALDVVASPDCLRRDQRAWEDDTARTCAGDAGCTAGARSTRAAELAGLLPGASAGADPGPAGGVSHRLLAVAGGEADAADAETGAGADALQPVELRGRPLETEGGYALAGPGFDAAAWDDFEALLGDEEALRARFGDGPVVVRGLVGSFPAMTFDDRGLAAIEAVAAAGGELLVRGGAVPEPDVPPALDLRACLYVYARAR